MAQQEGFQARYRWFSLYGVAFTKLKTLKDGSFVLYCLTERKGNKMETVWKVNTNTSVMSKLDVLPHDATPTPVFDFQQYALLQYVVHGRVKKWSLVQAHKPSIHLSWETVLFSVMGYYNHWAWKAMYDSSFPTPFPPSFPSPSLATAWARGILTVSISFLLGEIQWFLLTPEASLSSDVFYFDFIRWWNK